MLLTRLLFKDNKCSKNRPKKNIFLWNYILKWNTCPDFHPNFIIFGKLDAIERCFRETHRVSRVRRAGWRWSWMKSSHQGVGPAYAESSASVKKKKRQEKGIVVETDRPLFPLCELGAIRRARGGVHWGETTDAIWRIYQLQRKNLLHFNRQPWCWEKKKDAITLKTQFFSLTFIIINLTHSHSVTCLEIRGRCTDFCCILHAVLYNSMFMVRCPDF